MIRALGLSAIIAILALPGFAQDSNVKNDSTSRRKSTHYIGIQANQLVKQLLNLGGSTSAINNPYLITYSVNSNKNGVGLNLSVGYTIDEIVSFTDQRRLDTDIQEIFFRIGVERKTRLGKRWILSAGGDIVVEDRSNITSSSFNNGSGGSSTSTDEETVHGVGTGLRAGLNFHITDRVLLGTEANYYFKFVTTTITSESQFGSPTDTTDDARKFQLSVPAVLFLIIKL